MVIVMWRGGGSSRSDRRGKKYGRCGEREEKEMRERDRNVVNGRKRVGT